jgi:sulfatase maturation enzyme AslB (radical SAM superfamily)
MIAEKVINNTKRTETGEIIVTLFEYCDISCLFCAQDHNSMAGIDTIKDKIEPIKKAIAELQKKGKTVFTINIMGGEVFSDKLPDSVYDDYVILVHSIKSYCSDNNIEVSVQFTTNFIWTNTQRVSAFLEKTKVKLYTSYDPSGRFNVDTFKLFTRNVFEFTPHIRSVNVIMTKPNLDRFVTNVVPFFDYLYKHFPVYFDYYTPEKHMDVLLPKDYELRNFMKYMYDVWPNCSPFNGFNNKTKQNMSCMDTYTIMPNEDFGRCDILLKGVIPIKLIPSKKDLEQAWFDDYKCLECEHFNRCSLGCFLSNHIKDARTQEECWLKEVYDYVDNKWN